MWTVQRVVKAIWRLCVHELQCLFGLVWGYATLVVSLPCGKVKGEVHGETLVLKGVPYAEPFTGENRWKAPVRIAEWPGVRSCLKFVHCCPQAINGSCTRFSSIVVSGLETVFRYAMLRWGPESWRYQGSDDALCLNVWCNAKELDGKVPVMVFVHGGAFVVGSGGPPIYDGDVKVKHGVILVTLNYRLGVLGNLRVPGCDGNRGLRDVVCALEWVHDNIAALGGDPANITLFGESAGAMTVANILASPLRVKGGKSLFRRAICMSGAASNVLSQEKADHIYRRFMSHMPEGTTVSDLSTLPYEALSKAQSLLVRGHFKEYDEYLTDDIMILVPHVDGDVLPDHPLKALAKGVAKDVELVLGTNLHEYTLFMGPHRKRDMDTNVVRRIETWLQRHGCGEQSTGIDEVYERSDYAAVFKGFNDHKKYNAVATDWVFRLPAHRMAEAHTEGGGSTHVYRFDRELPFGSLGAAHGSELPLLFGQHHALSLFMGTCTVTDNSAKLLQETWTSIAKDGVNDEWPTYTHARKVLSLCGGDGTLKEVVSAPHDDTLNCWGDVGHHSSH